MAEIQLTGIKDVDYEGNMFIPRQTLFSFKQTLSNQLQGENISQINTNFY